MSEIASELNLYTEKFGALNSQPAQTRFEALMVKSGLTEVSSVIIFPDVYSSEDKIDAWFDESHRVFDAFEVIDELRYLGFAVDYKTGKDGVAVINFANSEASINKFEKGELGGLSHSEYGQLYGIPQTAIDAYPDGCFDYSQIPQQIKDHKMFDLLPFLPSRQNYQKEWSEFVEKAMGVAKKYPKLIRELNLTEYFYDSYEPIPYLNPESILPTQENIEQGKKDFEAVLQNLPASLEIVRDKFTSETHHPIKGCFMGFTAFASQASFAVEPQKAKSLKKFINDQTQGRMDVLVSDIKDHRGYPALYVVNVSSAQKIMAAYDSIFPKISANNITQWMKDNFKFNDRKSTIYMGLLSGFPGKAVENYEMGEAEAHIELKGVGVFLTYDTPQEKEYINKVKQIYSRFV